MRPVDLTEHPECGRFCEVFRSAVSVHTSNKSNRSALTHIYFSLNPGEKSRFHRVAGDEVWSLYQGADLYLYLWAGDNSRPQRFTLSAEEDRFCQVVPAGTWQAAEPVCDKILGGCSVAPGFEFADFEIMTSESGEAGLLLKIDLGFGDFI